MQVDNTTIVVTTYLVYVALSVFLTIWVGHTLHKNGRVFLVEFFTATKRSPIRSITCWSSDFI